MNRARGEAGNPGGLTGAKPNRLRRSCRRTQETQETQETRVASPKSQHPDFKTPTRIPRPRAAAGFTVESPNNDSDFQQDIIWDATSPSPNRLGKRGKKQKPPGVVDISEIVSRIAPKHGRPKVAEPTLQQWIGDSATIPCTPDVQVPKPKKRSPRPNGVDDLLKLAKQFDFNMFRQDEEEVEDQHQQSLELLSEDILDLENDDQNNVSLSLPVSCQPAVKVEAAAGTDVPLHLDQHMEDDLDFLFDGPTQHISVNLSQVSSAQQSQVKPASKEASGKPPAFSLGPTSCVSTTITKGTSAKDEFEDDWDNDDLLNDSLVLEMTQNPQKFTAPQHCSTQKPPSQRESPANVEVQSAASKVEKDNVRPRMTFKLEPNPNFSLKRTQSDTWTNSKVDYGSKTAPKDTRQIKFLSPNSVLVEAGSQRTWQTSNTVKSDPQIPQFHHQTSVSKQTTTASNTSATNTAQSVPMKPASVSSRSEAPAVPDLLDEDLSSFFTSDPVWDDPADDDLLCEMCEDVESQIQSAENVTVKQTPPGGHMSNQRASLPPSTKNLQPTNQQPLDPPKKPSTNLMSASGRPAVPFASGKPAGTSLTGGFVSSITADVQMKDSFRYTQTKNTLGSTNASTRTQASSRVQPATRGNPSKDQFTFKKPNSPVSTGTSKVPGKCSAAEIELKKQQAMERRRQKKQATQNTRAPT
ncbi:ewing's tumor-associated antigen 1 [Anoplopoma fimbria]|uniref:ewing's tumor-associated antigen 1 n=1 Tax=Anoplopoma fimbria TaxID=229290 RepID=UPI0023ED299C|nr:ewing's tumor-associated antigen 1 [Anoplopoma fimbria]